MPYKRHIMKPAQTNSVWFLTCRCFSYNLVSLLEILTMLIHFLMVLQFWVVFWMWFCVAVLRIKQVSWQIWRALWQGWSRMNVLRECPIRLSRHIWGCFFRHVRRYFFKRKIPRTLNHPKAYHTLISVAFQPFAGDMLHPYAQGEMGKVALGKVIYGRFWDCDVRSNGLHTAHLWCEIQLPGPVERYGQTGSAGAFNEGMNEPSLFWRRFDKARSLQYSWSMAILRKFFFQAVWAIMPGALVDWGRNWTQKGVNFQLDQEDALDDLIRNLKLLNLYATKETDYIGLRSMHASSQTVKSWHLRPIKQNPTMCQDDPTVC